LTNAARRSSFLTNRMLTLVVSLVVSLVSTVLAGLVYEGVLPWLCIIGSTRFVFVCNLCTFTMPKVMSAVSIRQGSHDLGFRSHSLLIISFCVLCSLSPLPSSKNGSKNSIFLSRLVLFHSVCLTLRNPRSYLRLSTSSSRSQSYVSTLWHS
jgi:hypothetical protein